MSIAIPTESGPSSTRGFEARLGYLASAACLFISSVAVVVLAGWVFEIEGLKTILYRNPIAMNPSTAVSFLLCATSLWLKRNRTIGAAAFAANTCAALVAGIALLVLLWQLGGWDTHVDEWLFRSQLAPRPGRNRMAPNTALDFLMAGLALLLLDFTPRRAPRPAQILTLAAICVALMAIIGYLLVILSFYQVSKLVPMAFNTALCFAVLCLGILCARPDREPVATITSATAGGIMARRLLPAAFGVPLLLGWLLARGAQASTPMGLSILAVGTIVAFNLLVWWIARLLYRLDERRRAAEEQLQRQNRLLEQAILSEQRAHHDLKETQSHMVQSEKLVGLGQMVAGIAHEINNPLAFVSNNVAVLQRDMGAVSELLKLTQQAQAHNGAMPEHDRAVLLAAIRDRSEQIDLPYTLSNLPSLMASSREGLRRIQQIVKDLRDFARLDESDLQDVDVNAGIESTANIIRSRATDKGVRVELKLSPLPAVACYPAKINQVVMNLIANAIDASSAGGVVSIRTTADESGVCIDVADDGCGIDPAIRDRIFDPFFTTKPIGQGTGLGLSISYGIIREHGGSIAVDSTPGRGSRFTVRLPCETPAK